LSKSAQLAATILSKHSGRFLIGIDGALGSGKSTLADAIAPTLKAEVVSLDLFLNEQQGQYFKSLRLEQLKRRIAGARGPTVVEGVCLLQVLDAISTPYDELVYVKRMDGGWSDEAECDVPSDPEARIAELLTQMREIDQAMGGEPSKALPAGREEVLRYHAKYRPQDRATFEYWTTI